MRRAVVGLVLGLVVGSGAWAQGPRTPFANLGVRTDANGYLVASSAQVTNPIGPRTPGANAQLRTDSNGYLLIALDSSGAPSDAEYWVGAADGDLSAEKNLGVLATALVVNTAGVPSAYAGIDCTNQFVRDVAGSGAGTCGAVVLTADVSGVLPVANGGTNASSAGITAFNNITGYTAAGATGTTSTNLVFSTSPVLVTPALGTPTALVLTSATGLPLTTGVTGVLPLANGGTDLSAAADDTTLVSTGTAWVATAVTNCADTGGNHLNYTAATNTFSCGTSGAAGAMTLLVADSGSDTSTTNPTDVDSVVISGLTATDTLLIYINATAVTQDTAAFYAQNTTDGVNLLVVTSAFTAGTGRITQGFTRQSAAGVTAVHSWGQSHDFAATVNTVTDWTGTWTLALRHEGVTSGGTLHWSWAVYKVAGQ